MVFSFLALLPSWYCQQRQFFTLKKMWETLPQQKMPCGGVLLQLRPWVMVIFSSDPY